MHPPPPLPSLSADSYPLTLERQKETPRPFPSTGLESLPFNLNREYAQPPSTYRYPSGREFLPNVFYPPMRDMPYPSYTEAVPFSDCISVGYPMLPGRFFTYVEQYHFANPPCTGEHPLFNKGIGSTVPGFGEDFVSKPRFDKSYPLQLGTFEPQMFGARPGGFPQDLQFCQYSNCGNSAKFCEYSVPTGSNDFVSYTETVNVLSFPSMANSSKSKNENLFEQSPDGCVLISQSKVCSNQVRILIFAFQIIFFFSCATNSFFSCPYGRGLELNGILNITLNWIWCCNSISRNLESV